MAMIMNRFVKNAVNIFSKNSTRILTWSAAAGVVSTAALGIRATPKALSIIDDFVWEKYENEVEDQDAIPFYKWLGIEDDTDVYYWKDRVNYLTKREIITLTWKTYLPTIISGAITIVCIVGSNHISNRRNAALASLYGLSKVALEEYQAKVVEMIGKNKEVQIRDAISADRIKRNPPGTSEVIITGKGSVLCFDTLSGRYFRSDIEQIRRIVNELNHSMVNDMLFLPLNDLYYALGLSGISLGDQVGWDVTKGDGMIEISFSTQLSEQDEPCLVLNYDVEPKFMK